MKQGKGLFGQGMMSRGQKFLLLSLIPIYFMFIGLFLQPLDTILPGIIRLIREPDFLITDYFVVGGVGAALINAGVLTLMINAKVYKLPEVVPDEWAVSKFRVGKGALRLVTVLGSAASLLSVYLNATTLSTGLLLLNVVVIAAAFIFAALRGKQAHVEISYEKA